MRPDSKHEAVSHKLDIFIAVAIAGTLYPRSAARDRRLAGRLRAVLQWTAVLLDILPYKTLARRSIPALSLTIYLVMGWTAIFFLPRLIRNASLPLCCC